MRVILFSFFLALSADIMADEPEEEAGESGWKYRGWNIQTSLYTSLHSSCT
jgi:hypothetical protein